MTAIAENVWFSVAYRRGDIWLIAILSRTDHSHMRLYASRAIVNVVGEICIFWGRFLRGIRTITPIDTNTIPIVPNRLGMLWKNIYEKMMLESIIIGDKSQKIESGIWFIDL
jgi:hypothetical protein